MSARFLKLFTILPLGEIDRLASLGGAEINEAKKTLATEATTLLHGATPPTRRPETARRTFEEGGPPKACRPSIVPADDFHDGVRLLKIAGAGEDLPSSNGDARRQIQGGAMRVNDVPSLNDDKLQLTESAFNADGAIKLSMGRKKHVLLKAAS